MAEQMQSLENKIRAQEKTIRILSERLEQHTAEDVTGLALFEQNIALEHVVAKRTRELEEHHIELERALADLKAAQAELLHAQKLQAIGQLASGIAHEINTPTQYVANNITFLEESFGGLLQGMQLCKDLLDTGAERQRAPDCLSAVAKAVELADFEYLSEEIPNALKECTEGMRRISVIVSAMKDFAHPSGGNMQPVDLPALIESTAEISRNEWKLVADLETQFDPELPNVDGLRDELSQAMLNLIVNAAHAIADKNPGGAERGLIRIVARRNAEWAEVLVADNGCGVPKELQEKIFEPFFTTKEVGRGSGQGLAIVYNVVADKHHGKLTVDSEPGKETVFTIRLPLQAQPLAPNGGL